MPTEFRFDDLDLREEPALDARESTDSTTTCTTTNTCTRSDGQLCTSTIC